MSRIGNKIGLTLVALFSFLYVGYKTLPSILPLPKADIEIHRSQNVNREYYNRELEKSQQRQDRMCDLNDCEKFNINNKEKSNNFIEILNNKHNVNLENRSEYGRIIKKLSKKTYNSISNKEELPELMYLTIFPMYRPWLGGNREKASIELGKEYKNSSFWPSKRKFKGDCTEVSSFTVSLAKNSNIGAYFTDVIVDDTGLNLELYCFEILNDLFVEPHRGGHMCALLKFDNEPMLFDFARNDGFDIAHKEIKVMNDLEAILNYHREIAVRKSDDGQFYEAIDNYQTIVKVNPENIVAYNGLGIVYLKQSEYKQAITEFEKILEINPKYQPAYNNLGVAYFHLSELDEAIKYFDLAWINQMKDQSIKWPCIYYNIGVVLLKQGKNKQAIKKFAQVLRICKDQNIHIRFPELNPNLFEKMSKNDSQELIPILKTLKSRNY